MEQEEIISRILRKKTKHNTSMVLKKEKKRVKNGCGFIDCRNCSLKGFLNVSFTDKACFESNEVRNLAFKFLILFVQEKELKKHLMKGRF